MNQPNETGMPSGPNHAGAKLVALALVLTALAIAADLTWMLPPDAKVPGQASAQDAPAPAAYFPSQFKLQGKDDEVQAPTF